METVKYKHNDSNLRLFEIITKYRFPHDEWEQISDVTTEWSWRCFGFVPVVLFKKRETPLSQITANYVAKSITEGRTVCVPDIEIIHKLYAMIDPLKLKVSNRGNYFEIKLLMFLLLMMSGICSCSSIKRFNDNQERIGRRYWQNVLEHQHSKHYSVGNPRPVRK